ncbi:hypothetical protein CONLIGDRAFT_633691 [Coniochaeta ligniaria NRRL 30616]|uniref:Uncharacterized protein n=1 Tax=Coniochaeta ligniaria NRRL 30616 TaxID=1408157 RepID=A0A1J7IIX0_9PEZI|nr:hypothetical protein CONLIGDRAFT_633691 [Coniochaeta ligniaria NRRL 30616]
MTGRVAPFLVSFPVTRGSLTTSRLRMNNKDFADFKMIRRHRKRHVGWTDSDSSSSLDKMEGEASASRHLS